MGASAFSTISGNGAGMAQDKHNMKAIIANGAWYFLLRLLVGFFFLVGTLISFFLLAVVAILIILPK